jgi:hypothetical protein
MLEMVPQLTAVELLPLPDVVERIKAADDEELAKFDIAAVNLMCAGDLPGAESLDFGRYFDWLDDAAREAELATRRHW